MFTLDNVISFGTFIILLLGFIFNMVNDMKNNH